MASIHELIAAYQSHTAKIVCRLREHFEIDNLLAGVRSNAIPKAGNLTELRFEFHGVGCRGELEGLEADFDFGPKDRIDGFDAWRLYQFAKQLTANFPEFQSLQAIEAAIYG